MKASLWGLPKMISNSKKLDGKVTVIALVTSVLLIGVIVWNKKEDRKNQYSLLESIAVNLATGIISGASIVYLGTKSIEQYINEADRNKRFGDLKYFWSNDQSNPKLSQKKKFIIIQIISKEESHKSDVQCEYNAATHAIASAINDIYGRDKVDVDIFVRHDDYSVENSNIKCEEANIVIVGCSTTSNKMRNICKDIGLFYLQKNDDNLFTISDPSESDHYQSKIIEKDSATARDFSSVNRILINDRILIIVNCCYFQGLFHAVNHIIDQEKLKSTGFLESISQIPVDVDCDYRHALISTDFNYRKVRNSRSSLTSNSSTTNNKFARYQLNQGNSKKIQQIINSLAVPNEE
jgi:hypothetical protein